MELLRRMMSYCEQFPTTFLCAIESLVASLDGQ